MNSLPIASAGPWITEKEIAYVLDACQNGWYDQWHHYLDRFEKALGDFLDLPHVMATSSCTGAIHLIMRALKLGPGDEVIVPNNTWVGSVAGVLYERASLVFCDVLPDTWCLDPASVEKKIGPKTKAIIAVHMYGHPCEMDELLAICDHHHLTLIEDAAPGIGSYYKGRPLGSLGHVAAFSFQGAKPLVMGEGGAIATRDSALFEKILFYADHGRDPKKILYNSELGLKYRASNLQAALGLGQIERLEEIIFKRRQIFFWYQQRLKEYEDFALNVERSDTLNNFYVPSLVLKKESVLTPEDLMKKFQENQIGHRPFFRCLSLMPPFRQEVETPVAFYLSDYGINLPCATLMREEEVDRVCEVIIKGLKR